jgi:hypothetical protein
VAEEASERLAAARRAAATALGKLQEAENRVADATDELSARAALELDRRAAHEAARAVLGALDLEAATAAAEAASIDLDRSRLPSSGRPLRPTRGAAP